MEGTAFGIPTADQYYTIVEYHTIVLLVGVSIVLVGFFNSLHSTSLYLEDLPFKE